MKAGRQRAGTFADWRAVAAPGRPAGVLGLLLLCVLTLPFFSDSRAPDPPRAVDGRIAMPSGGRWTAR